MLTEQKSKIYTLLLSEDEANMHLAISLAKGQGISLKPLWLSLKNYFTIKGDYRAATFITLLQRLKKERFIHIHNKISSSNIAVELCYLIQDNRLITLNNINPHEVPNDLFKTKYITQLSTFDYYGNNQKITYLPQSLIESDITHLNVSFSYQLDYERLWNIASKMPKLIELKWLNNISVTLQKELKPLASLYIPYTLRFFRNSQALTQYFPHLASTQRLEIDLRPLWLYHILKIHANYQQPTVLAKTFLPNFFEPFQNIRLLTIHLCDHQQWKWGDTFKQLLRLDQLQHIIIRIGAHTAFRFDVKNRNFLSLDDDLILIKKKKLSILNHQHRNVFNAIAKALYNDITTISIAHHIQCHQFPKSLLNFSALKCLYLSRLKLKSLPKDWTNLSRLEQLDLSHNAFSDWTTTIQTINTITSLKILDLSNNNINTLPLEQCNFTQLEALNLSNNQLIAIPEWIKDLKQLKTLYLGRNKITQIPDWLHNTSIERLHLSNNHIKKVDASFFVFDTLKELYLDSNYIQRLSPKAYQLPNLNTLVLANNPLEAIPTQLFDSTQLTRLIFNACQLNTLPENIQYLSQLQELQLANNLFEGIPESIKKCSKLEVLNLAYNHLETTESILDLPRLESLNLEGNLLQQLPLGIEKMPNLKELKASKNPIQELPSSGNFDQLKNVYFDNTNITHLPNIFIQKGNTISLKGIIRFDWRSLAEDMAKNDPYFIHVLWKDGERFRGQSDSTKFRIKKQNAQESLDIINAIKNMYYNHSVILFWDRQDINYLDESWKHCLAIKTLHITSDNFDIKKSLPVLATLKGIRILRLSPKKQWWRKKIQAVLHKNAIIKFAQ